MSKSGVKPKYPLCIECPFQNETILAMVKGVDFLSSSEIIPETTVSS